MIFAMSIPITGNEHHDYIRKAPNPNTYTSTFSYMQKIGLPGKIEPMISESNLV
jgi:hypothetical protein